jgi:hypothetical protein
MHLLLIVLLDERAIALVNIVEGELQGLTVKEMEELRQDIKMHLDLDRATQTHIEFWEVSLKRLF